MISFYMILFVKGIENKNKASRKVQITSKHYYIRRMGHPSQTHEAIYPFVLNLPIEPFNSLGFAKLTVRLRHALYLPHKGP